MEEWFSEKRGRRVRIHHPKKGEKYNLIRMVAENARDSFRNRQAVRSEDQSRLENVRKELHLQKLPVKIECFDISNISGKLAVGSMVAFTDGRPDKRHYRHFKIQTVDQPDDCKMMYEVVRRRFSGSSRGSDLPDLVIMDGGKGQLNSALRVFRELNVVEIDAIGLAKSEQGDMIFIPRRKNPILLKRNSNTLLLLQQIRDEAHRFAVSYHKKIRKKQNLRSILDDIPGVGSVRKRALLKHFGSLQSIKKARFEELTEVKGMNRQVAGNVFEFFQNLPSESQLSSEVPNIVEPNPWSPREEQY